MPLLRSSRTPISLRMAAVETVSRVTNGRSTVATRARNGAMARAMVSGKIKARRLGTSSPRITET
jgi:hypothetical protein